MPGSPAQWGLLVVLSVAHLLTDLVQGVVPILGVFLHETAGLSLTAVGLLSFVMSASSSILQPVFGLYSDRVRVGWLIPAALLAAGLGLSGVAFTTRFETLLLFIGLAGLGGAMFHPDGMRTARALAGGRTATGMAVFQVGGNAGVGLGPSIAALLLSWLGLRGMVLAALPVLAWAVVVALALRALAAASAEATAQATGAVGLRTDGSMAAALPQPGPYKGVDRWDAELRVLGAVVMRSMFLFSLSAFVPFYYVEVLGVPAAWSGPILTTYWVSGALGTLTMGPLADRIGIRRYFILALLALAPLHLLVLSLPSWWNLVFFALEGFVGVSTMVISVVLSQDYLPNRMALASGLNVGIGLGVGGVGTALVGWSADVFGLVPTLYALTAVPLVAAAIATTLPKPERAAS